MCIAKTKEFVYYHPLKACLPKEIIRDELIISANTRSRLEASHRKVIWREFGLCELRSFGKLRDWTLHTMKN